MKKALNFALIGHQFMGRAHSNALRQVGHVFPLDVTPTMKVLCGVGDDLEAAAEMYGWERTETDWHKVVTDPDIDAIAICTPGTLHAPIAIEAARNGKHVICEKPLSNNIEESKAMLEAVDAAGVVHVCNFCYRRVPAIVLAKELIDSGKLGNIVHICARYQQDWAAYDVGDYVWRFDNALAGGGAIADKGSHIIDLARHLVGDFSEVVSFDKIFYPYKENPTTGERKEVTSDDCSNFLCNFKNGATGVFQTSRISLGNKNRLELEINGAKGTIKWNLERLNELELYLPEDPATNGFRTIHVTEDVHNYAKNWWPSGHSIGWEHGFVHQYYEFIQAITSGTAPNTTTFEDGLKTQEIIDCLVESGKTKQWVNIK